MRTIIAAIFVLFCAAGSLFGGLAPLNTKDVSLMLRSGYSADAVQRELAARHFLGAIDPAAEKALVQAGAPQVLIDALKNGTFAVPAADVSAVQQELAAKAERRAAQAQEAQKFDTLYQARQAEGRSAATPTNVAANSIAALVKGDLVASKSGVLSAYADGGFEKKRLIGLYFSAHWCPPCRKFTPELVAFYNRVAAAHPEFEILFVSSDKTSGDMQTYMRETQMPWPAVSFEKIRSKQGLLKYEGDGIPCLVVVDASGKDLPRTVAGAERSGAVVRDDADWPACAGVSALSATAMVSPSRQQRSAGSPRRNP